MYAQVCRKHNGWALDDVVMFTEVTKNMKEDLRAPATDGVFIVRPRPPFSCHCHWHYHSSSRSQLRTCPPPAVQVQTGRLHNLIYYYTQTPRLRVVQLCYDNVITTLCSSRASIRL